MSNDTLTTELQAQRQRHHEALERKNSALAQIEDADKVILETSAVIQTLEFSLRQQDESGPPEDDPPEIESDEETRPA